MTENLGSGFINEQSGFVNNGETAFKPLVNETLLSNQGAMSDTYLRVCDTGRKEIVKRIKADCCYNETYRQLFVQEYQNLAALQHPNIVNTYQSGEDKSGLWYSMEYVDGKTLTEIIKSNEIRELNQKTDILRQILDALIYVHNKGLIHRDLKPDNIMIAGRNRNVKIIDFGLAMSDAFDDKLKKAGTPRYMSPEQKNNSQLVDKQSDIFAFGIIMQEFFGKEFSQIPQYKRIIDKCVKHNKSERYQNCNEILDDLRDKNKVIPQEVENLILEIVDDGIVTEKEREELNAKVKTYDLDEDVVRKRLEYLLEKWHERRRRKTILFSLFGLVVIIVGIVSAVLFLKPEETKPFVEAPKTVDSVNVDKTVVEQPIEKPADNSSEAKPKIETPKSEAPKPAKPKLDYGTFDGAIINGQPDGYGNLIYSKEHLLNKNDLQKRKAMPGDRVEGDFKNGNLIQGEIIRKDGSREFIMIGG